MQLRHRVAICSTTSGYPWDFDALSPDQGAEAAGALLLCPDHPSAGSVPAVVDTDQLRSEGKLAGEGSYLVGAEIQPGTWQSQGDRVEDCYWEVSDAQGEIIDNNFISVAPQFTITVPATAAGFTVSGCAFRWIGP